MIDDEIERLDHIVDELLGFSRGMSIQLEPCDLQEVADDVKRLCCGKPATLVLN